MDDPDRLKKLLTGHTLKQVTLSAGLDRAQNTLIGIKGGEDNGPSFRVTLAKLGQGLHAIKLRHLQVQQNHIWIEGGSLLNDLGSGSGLTDHLKIRLGAKNGG